MPTIQELIIWTPHLLLNLFGIRHMIGVISLSKSHLLKLYTLHMSFWSTDWCRKQANGSLVSKKSHGVTYLRDLPLVKVQNAESPVGFCFFLAQVIEDLWEEAP
mmetsp:Transcript_28520/g.42589  ORF Transcript_28520/g.42589 Transcript_28520/m.42589 type:complete len:104 (+) Transcript_28520:1023-1334(+)